MQLATVSAYETGVALPLTNVAKEMYRLAMREGHAAEDFSAIYEFVTDTDHSRSANTLLEAGPITRKVSLVS